MTQTLQKATPQDIYDISLQSAQAKSKQVYIYELGSMSDFLTEDQAEEIRSCFVKNRVRVQQITNTPVLPKFSNNQEFIDTVMSFRYVPKDIYDIIQEILIFDEIVAIYTKDSMLIIEDSAFAESQKQLFTNLWDNGQSPQLGFEYRPNHSFYNDIDYQINNTQIIVWPDADAKISYKGLSKQDI